MRFNKRHTRAVVDSGLILTTMCIDLVGGDMINRIHYFGTHVQMAREVRVLAPGLHDARICRRWPHGAAELAI